MQIILQDQQARSHAEATEATALVDICAYKIWNNFYLNQSLILHCTVSIKTVIQDKIHLKCTI